MYVKGFLGVLCCFEKFQGVLKNLRDSNGVKGDLKEFYRKLRDSKKF